VTVTAELSLYPLSKDYESAIISFIKSLRQVDELTVLTHSMSTFVKGDHVVLMKAISDALESVNAQVATISLVVKLINRDLPVEKGFIELA